MGCNSPGATHHLACDCREDAICKEVAELRERLAASEKAREDADAYAGRANARIADLGERLDATEAVLRDAEKARKEAERERDAYRHEWNVSSRQQGAETRTRYAAESRAASLSRELLDAMQARDRLAERAVTMQLMLDTIEGWATGQPGKMPTAVEDGWSTALSAAVARVTAAESRAARLAEALAPFADPERYNTAEEECRENKAMRWCAVHSFRWPCPVGPARAALAAEEGK